MDRRRPREEPGGRAGSEREREAHIGALRNLPEGSRQSGDDSGLRDCWEEYKYQVQRQHSLFFEMYEELLVHFCEKEVASLGREQKGLLWLWGDGFVEWDEKELAPEGRPEGQADSHKAVELDWMPFTSSDIESMEARAGRHFFRFGEKVLWRVQGRTFVATVGGPAHCGFVVCLDPEEDERRMHLRGARLPSRDLPDGLWYASESELEPVEE